MFYECIFFFRNFDVYLATIPALSSKVAGGMQVGVAGEGRPMVGPSDSKGRTDDGGPIAVRVV